MLCAVVLGLASCATVVYGSFADSGYLSGYGYEVAYRSGTKQVMPSMWDIDNYRPGQGQWVPKEQDEYITKYEFDIDDDGSVDIRITRPIYALRYEPPSWGRPIRTGLRVGPPPLPRKQAG